MCKDITSEFDANYGRLVLLCDAYDTHLTADQLPSWPIDHEAAGTVLKCLGLGQGCTAILELGYFDIDFRSEFSLTHETVFGRSSAQWCIRAHFFRGSPPHSSTIRETAAGLAANYVGYSIIRPQQPGAIGRSVMAAPPRSLSDEWTLIGDLNLQSRVPVTIHEEVNLFGIDLVAVGVPFLAQDGHVLRCAHVSAWTCHFSAVLRGLVPRRSTAHFHRADQVGLARGRQYPSEGLSDIQISDVLSRLDLPPHMIQGVSNPAEEPPPWYIRKEIWDLWRVWKDAEQVDLAQGTATGLAAWDRLHQAWNFDRKSASICQYLNSGFPVVVSWSEDQSSEDDQQDHTQVLTGYLRSIHVEEQDRSELTEDKADVPGSNSDPAPLTHSDVKAFVLTDDSLGPYQIVAADKVLSAANAGMASLLVPLPRGLWLSAEAAEAAGGAAFELASGVLQPIYADWLVSLGLVDDADSLRARWLDRMTALCSDPDTPDRPFAMRSYAMLAVDFKRLFPARAALTGRAADLVGFVNLPRHVWVVELIDRGIRATRSDEMVVATVLIDGSASDLGEAEALLCHIPGALANFSKGLEDVTDWILTGESPYRSGRSENLRHVVNSAYRFKGAVSA